MKSFSYVIKDNQGQIRKGVLDVESQDKLIEYFHKESCVIISIKERKKTAQRQHSSRISVDDLVIFSRQFTTLIESGIPAVESLAILQDQVEKPYFKAVIAMILKDVREGASLANTLKKHPKVFPEIYVSMVEAAEVSGNLPEILERLSIYLEKSSALRKKVASAMYYPVIILLMAGGITTFLMVKVIPTFQSIFDMLGGNLPLPTQILLLVSNVLRSYFLIVVIVFIVVSALFLKYINTDRGKRQYHKTLLRLPILGNLIRKIAIAKFARTFATLVRSGVTVIKCLDIVAKTSGNKILEEAVIKAKKSILEGQPISLPLEESGIFPPMVTKMIAIGEKSGKLEEMLSKVAQFYEEQTDAMITGLSSLIEPLVIGVLGVVIGGIVVSLFLPIIKITQYIGTGM
ncbi:MAG: type II secretion system F family protein [Candidatus Omnitrophica bacterium]|nr:type II secretion system F family protein [Candidatus Omnitrophota bacterium]